MKNFLLGLTLCLISLPAFAAGKDKESVYDRVMRTQTIRCGYVAIPPHIVKDPNSGALSGIIYDVMEEAGKLLDLKIDWTEEVGLGTMNEGLKQGRYDAVCFGYWQNPFEGKLGFIDFSTPLYYMPVGAFVRPDDTRFDADITAINDPTVRISSSDGMISGIIAAQDFPKAQIVSLPNMTDVGQNLMDVAAGKADVTFLSLHDAFRFEKSNPGQIKNVAKQQPVRVFGNTIALPQSQGDRRFKVMIDTALIQMLNGGFVDRALKKYEEYPGAVLPVAKPYVALE